MGLKAVVDSLDAVPEALKGEYEQRDGKFFLRVDGDAEALFPGLKANRDALLSEKRQLAEKLQAYEGIDPARARELMAAAQKAEQEKLKAQGDWEARERQLLDAHQAEVKKHTDALAKMKSTLERHLIEREAIAALSAVGAKVKPLLPHVTSSIKVFEENGEYVARVVGADGHPRIGDAKGTPMTLAQLIEEFKADPEFQGNFPASGAGGSGAPAGQRSGTNGQKTISRAAFDQMGPGDRSAFLKSGGAVVD